MQSFAETLVPTIAILLSLMLLLWMASLLRRDASIIDPFWGAGFVLVAWIALALNWPPAGRVWLLAILTTVWGLRLSLFLLWRNWGHGEDRRYRKMREHHGRKFWGVSLFTVFLLQGVILWFVSWPIQVAAVASSSRPLGWLDGMGVATWCIGFAFESIGDSQLGKFKADPTNAGKVMDRGLWRYTRHPNYFGDFCVWWGLYVIAATGGAWWTIASSLLMSVLLMKVSGVTLLESTIVDRRPGYADYKKRTNAFFPAPPNIPKK